MQAGSKEEKQQVTVSTLAMAQQDVSGQACAWVKQRGRAKGRGRNRGG